MGLKNNDLKDTVANLISIDEYEPKAGTMYELIVVAFHVIDEDPAQDLADFLEKSYIEVIDAEKSPNPNNDGYFLVFVEMKRDGRFIKNFREIVKEVERLSGKIDWKVSPYLSDDIYDLEDDYWENFVITNRDEYVSKQDFISSQLEKDENEEINAVEHFKDSNATKIIQEDGFVRLYNNYCSAVLSNVEIIDEKKFMESEVFTSKPFEILDEGRVEIKNLRNILGPSWSVYLHDNKALISDNLSGKIVYASLS